jgi:diguanylate cyclase (GGDEF)-like protein
MGRPHVDDLRRLAATEVLESMSDGYLAVDATGVLTFVNARAEEVLRVDRAEVVGACVLEALPRLRGSALEAALVAATATRRTEVCEGPLLDARVYCEVRACPLPDGGVGVYVLDLSDRRAADVERERLLVEARTARAAAEHAELELARLATHDDLTGLLNRAGLLMTAAEVAGRGTAGSVTALFLDLDHFKLVNDTLGHTVGDDVLVVVADRLRRVVGPGDVVARFGGDEFVTVVFDAGREEAEQLAAAVLDTFREPVAVGFSTLTVTGSIGMATAGGTASIGALLRDADAALHAAKDAGREHAAWFDTSMRTRAVRRVEVERDLGRALQDDELVLHYQPAFELGDGTVRNVEALVRWAQPGRGLLLPGEFIDVAEESGLILPLGSWVIAEAARQAVAWGAQMRTWVNVSAAELVRPGLAERLASILEREGLAPDRFGIELTESTLGDRCRLASELAAVHDLGVHIAIDDFGTGYSSLSRLARLPVDVLKIDRSFVHELGTERGDAMALAIITLAHSIGAEVIAEGVQTRAQLDRLATLGCETAAGFLLARPCPADRVPWRPGVWRTAPHAGSRPTGGRIPRTPSGNGALHRLQ